MIPAPAHSPAAASLTKSIVVAAARDLAFEVFTSRLETWWPLETHRIGATVPRAAVIEPRVGGRWYEVGQDGVECPWGRVLAYEPPERLLLTWEISANWKADSSIVTEVEVRFVAEGPERTRVDLEHRHLDRFGDRTGEMRGIFDSPGGWTGLLERFVAAVGTVS